MRIFNNTGQSMRASDAKNDAVTEIKQLAQIIKRAYTVRRETAAHPFTVTAGRIDFYRPDRNNAAVDEHHVFAVACSNWETSSSFTLKGGQKLSDLVFPMQIAGDPTGCPVCPAGQRPLVIHQLIPNGATALSRRFPPKGSSRGVLKAMVGMSFCAQSNGRNLALSLRGYYFDSKQHLTRAYEQFNFAPNAALNTGSGSGGIQVAPVSTKGLDLCAPDAGGC
jgi:hypothetical protein